MASTQPTAAAATLTGAWCDDDDESIWLGPKEVVMGEHGFCRYDPALTPSATYRGTLQCRTSETWHAGAVEHPLPLALSLVGDGALAIDYLDGVTPQIMRRCETF